MKNQEIDLAALSEDELMQRQKKLRGVTIGSSISMTILTAVLTYMAITTQQYALLVGSVALPLSVLPGVITWTKVNKEVKARGLS